VDQHTHFIHEPVTQKYTVERSPAITPHDLYAKPPVQCFECRTHIDMVIPGNDGADPPTGKVVEVLLRC